MIKTARFSTIILFLAMAMYMLATPKKTIALSMSNSNYILRLQTLDASNITPTKTPLQTQQADPRVITGDNFTLRQGLSYVFPVANFTFSLSTDIIDFGLLSPTNPITRTQLIRILTGSTYTYSVTAAEDHELALVDGTSIVIPNTTCDDGLCSASFASNWLNILTYGFGYHCKNETAMDCQTPGENTYKEFSFLTAKDAPETILRGAGASRKTQAQLTYKVNISTTQPRGVYANKILFVALPGY